MNSSIGQISHQIQTWKNLGLKVVLVTGVFDLLHSEHINFLQKAKAEADKLTVGIETDARVKQLKGMDRPINSETVRLQALNQLQSVDLAFLLPRKFSHLKDWEQLMDQLQPHLYAVSSHSSHLSNKRAICDKYQVAFKIVHQHNPDISTSKLLSLKKVASQVIKG